MSVRPSPALVVSAELSIGDCCRKMRDHKVGSVLVVRGTLPHDLVGIFTEKDLVRKIDEIQHGGYWEKSISTIMTHPVITISIYDIAAAPDLMMLHGIRHLPVVYEDTDGKQHIAGVISMRDIFTSLYFAGATSKKGLNLKSKFPRIAIASRDPGSRDVLKTLLGQDGKVAIDEVPIPEASQKGNMGERDISDSILKAVLKLNPGVLVLDIDFLAPAQWAKLLQKILLEPTTPQTLIFFTPDLHDSKNVAVLNHIDRKGQKNSKITVFSKPINVLEVLQKIQLSI